MPSLRLAVVTRGLVMPSWRLVTPYVRVAHGHRLRPRLVLESLRVVARLGLAPTQRPRRAAAAIVGAAACTTGPVVAAAVAKVALAAVWYPIPGVRSSAIFVIVMAAVVFPPPTEHLVTAIAVMAPAATPLTTIRATAMHSGVWTRCDTNFVVNYLLSISTLNRGPPCL